MADASPFAIMAGWEAPCRDQSEFSLQSGICKHKPWL